MLSANLFNPKLLIIVATNVSLFNLPFSFRYFENIAKSISPSTRFPFSSTCKAPKTCKTFQATEGTPSAHNFNQNIVKASALKSEATCDSLAVYYKSCDCGQISDTETFTRGNKKPHSYTYETVKEEALYSKATCRRPALYYYSCVCGEVGTEEIFEYGDPTHYYSEEIVKDDALKTQGEGTTLSVYYKSCVCGLVSETETFEVKTMVGKNIIVFGDTYSSYHSTLPTEGWYRVYYDGTNILNSADQMWFNLLVKERGGNIVRNDSSSGSTIGYTGYSGGDNSNSALSFIFRLENLISKGFFEENKIDVVYVLGGTNDSWCGAPLGEDMFSGWTKQDLFSVRPAICYFYCRLREVLPTAEIYGIANHINMKQEVIDSIVNACNYVNGKPVTLSNIQVTSSHPNELGMISIKNQILEVFDR